MTPEEEYELIIEDMMADRPTIYCVLVEYWEGVKQMYTFSIEDYQMDWIEYLRENADKEGVKEVTMFESVLDIVDSDMSMYIVH